MALIEKNSFQMTFDPMALVLMAFVQLTFILRFDQVTCGQITFVLCSNDICLKSIMSPLHLMSNICFSWKNAV